MDKQFAWFIITVFTIVIILLFYLTAKGLNNKVEKILGYTIASIMTLCVIGLAWITIIY